MRKRLFRWLPSQLPLKERIKKVWEMLFKCGLLIVFPLFPAAGSAAIWYYAIFQKHRHFDEHMENIISSAWIPTFGVLYSLLAAVVFTSVWNEYKTIRAVVKRYDLETFLDLRDEEMSPLVYAMMTVFSLAILTGFMSLKYPSALGGILITSSTAYLLSLIFFVIVEIDDPCGGIWFIQNIHDEWLKIDVKKWRRKRHEKERRKFEGELCEHNGRVTLTGTVENGVTAPRF
jgi:hypothetical protein